MGEQSTRALRGGKMEDVIFGGTAKRKQTGYAEVSLVLDNKLALRLLLPVAETGDAGGFLKDLPAVGGFDGQSPGPCGGARWRT